MAGAASHQQIDTEHTTIIFSEENLKEAQQVASYADEVYRKLSSFLDNQEGTKAPVIITDNTAWSNGYYTTFPSSVYLFIPSPPDRFLGSRTSDWLRSLYTHELTHFLHLTQHLGPARYLGFLGPGITAFSSVFMPGWWIEGITTYTESNFAQGGRGDSGSFALTYQVPFSEEKLWSIRQGAYNGPFTPTSRIYSTGYAMVDYLIRTYGVDSFNEINRRFSAFPFFGLGPAFKHVIGIKPEQLFTFALQAQPLLKADETAAVVSMAGQGDSFLPHNTDFGLLGFASSPYDGRALYRYEAERAPQKLCFLPLDDGDAISFGDKVALFSWLWADSGDPSSLTLAPVGYSDLALLDLDRCTVHHLTYKQKLVHPAINRDGTKAVASRMVGSYYELVRIDLATGTVSSLYGEQGMSFLESSFNDDGSKQLAIGLQHGNSSILLFSQEGKKQVLVGPTSSELRSPVFIDDDSVLFVSDRDCSFSVYQYDMNEQKVYRLHTDPYGIFSARVERDALLYESYSSEGIVLKKVPLLQLEREQVSFPPPTQPAEESSLVSSYPVTDYRDRLHLNLWLPYPGIEANALQLGVWMHASSLLRSQLLVGSIKLSIPTLLPVADVVYQMAKGSYGLQFALSVNAGIPTAQLYQQASLTITTPVYYKAKVSHTDRLSLQGQVEAQFVDHTGLYAGILTFGGSRTSSDYRTIDLFGPSSIQAAFGFRFSPSTPQCMGYLTASVQQRVFSSSSLLQVSLAAIASPSPGVGSYFPLASFSAKQDGEVKVRLSLAYRLPLALLDVPIPYGGLTKAGMELLVQSAWYMDEGTLLWEEAWALSIRLSANVVLGGTSTAFKPFLMVSYLVGDGAWQLTLGLDGDSIFELLSTV